MFVHGHGYVCESVHIYIYVYVCVGACLVACLFCCLCLCLLVCLFICLFVCVGLCQLSSYLPGYGRSTSHVGHRGSPALSKENCRKDVLDALMFTK